MKKIGFIFLFICFFYGYAGAQFLDSIQSAINQKGSFSFSFNSRNSYITTASAHIWGFMVGVRFDRKVAIGGGINVLNSPIVKTENIEGQDVQAKLNFSFVSYYVEYLFKLSKHWEIDVPLSIGIGGSSFTYTLAGLPQVSDKRTVIPLEPSVEVDYDFNKFWGLYIQTGYRWMLVNNKYINENFNSPTYSFGLLIYPLEIYAALFPHTGLAHTINDN